MSRKFTLVELVVVIAVIAVLASIVIPNISGLQRQATRSAVLSNIRAVQTAADLFTLSNHGAFPARTAPTEEIPQEVDFSLLGGDYLRKVPQTLGIRHWIDFTGRVWASSVGAPTGVVVINGNVAWQAVPGAVSYVVYEVSGTAPAGSLSRTALTKVAETTGLFHAGISGRLYIVSAVDQDGFKTAASGPGYVGRTPADPESQPVNLPPIAIIGMTPSVSVTSSTTISWGHAWSSDPEGDVITIVEWDNARTVYPVGAHTARLRVQDSLGLWSPWTSHTFVVWEPLAAPDECYPLPPGCAVGAPVPPAGG